MGVNAHSRLTWLWARPDDAFYCSRLVSIIRVQAFVAMLNGRADLKLETAWVHDSELFRKLFI